MARCLREKKQMALILWDIDGFMDFNNRFGQKEGDRFLRKVGDVLRLSIRVYDEAFRAGPDEFCTILTPADASVSAEVTNRVSSAVSKHLFEGEEMYGSQAFSISSGVVYYPGEHTVPEALLHAAMQALYQSRLTHSSSPLAG
jgi:diguanylate cyclase (GGDEF)-like protein